MVTFRGEESPVYRFVGPPQQQAHLAHQESGGGSQVSTAPSPSKRSNAFAALETEESGDEDAGLDPKTAARLRRLHALVGASSGYGEEEEEEDSAASDAAAASSTASAQGEVGKGGGETSTHDLWSMLAGMTPPPAGAAAAAQPVAVAAHVVTPAAVDDVAEEDEEEEEAQDFGWSAALSASETPGATGAAASEEAAEGEEEKTSSHIGRPPLPPSPIKPVAAAKPAPAAGKQKQKQKAGGGGDGGAGEESWPWSVGLDHRLKERAAEGHNEPTALPPTPPPSRASSTNSLATLPNAGGGGVANASVEGGVGAKLLRKMGWLPDSGDAGTPLSSLPPAATSVPLPRPERLGLGVPTPAEQASRLAAHEALDAVSGGNAQKKVALMMGGASTQPADAAWEDIPQTAGAQPAGRNEAQPPESWEQTAVAAVSAASSADAGPVLALKKVLLAHLRGMEDSLEVAVSAVAKQGGEEAAEELLRKMHKVWDLMQGPVWRGIA
jgi:hypothetical protein